MLIGCHDNHVKLQWEIKVLYENEATEVHFVVYLFIVW